jgi:hypothetical protein
MKKILLIAIFLLIITGTASAYEITISAPQSLRVGELIVVNGTSNLPAGVSFDITLSHSGYLTEIKETKTVIVQGDKNFSVVFPTTGYSKGTYKLEVLPVGNYRYLGNSVTLRVVELIDRSDEIVLTSPLTQYFSGKLQVAGTAKKVGNRGISLEITSPDRAVIFGPGFIQTSTTGTFSREVPIEKPGNYSVNFTDEKGYVGTFTFFVRPLDTNQLPVAASPSVAATPIVTASSLASASLSGSKDEPVYFEVVTRTGPVRIYTSSGVDWVIEYVDDTGTRIKMNNKGQGFPEEVTIQGKGDTRYFMVYPNKYSDQAEITLYAENSDNVLASNTRPSAFPSAGAVTPGSTQKAGLPLWIFIAAVGMLALLRKRGH